MAVVTIHLDTAKLAKLLERIASGEEVVLDCEGTSVARLVPDGARPLRKPGRLKGKIDLDESFFDPLPKEELAAWGQSFRLLLDTYALVWWFVDSPQLPRAATRLIGDPDNVVLVSAGTAWEIATKFRLGKLPSMASVVAHIESHVRAEGPRPLTVTMRHAQRAGSLPGPHKDPFDRILIAQALEETCTLISNEAVFDRYAVSRAW